MKRKTLAVSAAGLAALFVLTAAVLYEPVAQAPLAAVRLGDLKETACAPGKVIPREESVLTASMGGTVEELRISTGQIVAAGDAVLCLSGAQLQAELSEVEKALAEEAEPQTAAVPVIVSDTQAREALRQTIELAQTAGVEYAQFNDRVEAALLEKSSAVFAAEEAAEAQDRADAEKRRAQLLRWREELWAQQGELTLSSDSGGVVAEVFVRAGETILSGEPVARLCAPQGGLVETAGLPLDAGDAVALTVDGLTYSGTVYSAKGGVLLVEPQEGLYERAAQTGGAVEVSAVVRSAENVCIVPKSAVAWEGETSYVMVAERGRLRRREVVVMMEQGADAAISAGLGAGEQVACSPEGWKEGQRVQE